MGCGSSKQKQPISSSPAVMINQQNMDDDSLWDDVDIPGESIPLGKEKVPG